MGRVNTYALIYSTLSIHRGHFPSHKSRKAPHISPVRARNEVSFVGANLIEVSSHLCTIVSYITAIYRESIVLQSSSVLWVWDVQYNLLYLVSSKDHNSKIFIVSFCSCLSAIHRSLVLSQEWRCCSSSAGERCSNYNWVINNFIAFLLDVLRYVSCETIYIVTSLMSLQFYSHTSKRIKPALR